MTLISLSWWLRVCILCSLSLFVTSLPSISAAGKQPVLVQVNNEVVNKTNVYSHVTVANVGDEIALNCSEGQLYRGEEEFPSTFVLNEATQGSFHCRCGSNRSRTVIVTALPAFAFVGSRTWTGFEGDRVGLPCELSYSKNVSEDYYETKWKYRLKGNKGEPSFVEDSERYYSNGRNLSIRELTRNDSKFEYFCVITKVGGTLLNCSNGTFSNPRYIIVIEKPQPHITLSGDQVVCTSVDSPPLQNDVACLSVVDRNSGELLNFTCDNGQVKEDANKLMEIGDTVVCTVSRTANGSVTKRTISRNTTHNIDPTTTPDNVGLTYVGVIVGVTGVAGVMAVLIPMAVLVVRVRFRHKTTCKGKAAELGTSPALEGRPAMGSMLKESKMILHWEDPCTTGFNSVDSSSYWDACHQHSSCDQSHGYVERPALLRLKCMNVQEQEVQPANQNTCSEENVDSPLPVRLPIPGCSPGDGATCTFGQGQHHTQPQYNRECYHGRQNPLFSQPRAPKCIERPNSLSFKPVPTKEDWYPTTAISPVERVHNYVPPRRSQSIFLPNRRTLRLPKHLCYNDWTKPSPVKSMTSLKTPVAMETLLSSSCCRVSSPALRVATPLEKSIRAELKVTPSQALMLEDRVRYVDLTPLSAGRGGKERNPQSASCNNEFESAGLPLSEDRAQHSVPAKKSFKGELISRMNAVTWSCIGVPRSKMFGALESVSTSTDDHESKPTSSDQAHSPCGELWTGKVGEEVSSMGPLSLDTNSTDRWWRLGEVQTVVVTTQGGEWPLFPFSGSKSPKGCCAVLSAPSGVVEEGVELPVDYCILLDGPFILPTEYERVSVVVYLNCDNRLLKKPLELRLCHWAAPSNANDSHLNRKLSFMKAPHKVAGGQDGHHFVPVEGVEFSTTDASGVLRLKDHFCLVCIACEKSGPFEEKISKRCFAMLWKGEVDDRKQQFRVLVMYAVPSWEKLVVEYYFREVKSKLYSNDVRPFTFVKDSTLCLDIKEKKGPGWELLLLQSELSLEDMSFALSDLSELSCEDKQVEVERGRFPPAMIFDVGYERPPSEDLVQRLSKASIFGAREKITFSFPILENPRASCSYVKGRSLKSKSLPEFSLDPKALEDHVIPKMADKWRPFGIRLGVRKSILDSFWKKTVGDPEDCCREVLYRWMEDSPGEVRWDKVIQVMKDCERKLEAEELEGHLPETGSFQGSLSSGYEKCSLSSDYEE